MYIKKRFWSQQERSGQTVAADLSGSELTGAHIRPDESSLRPGQHGIAGSEYEEFAQLLRCRCVMKSLPLCVFQIGFVCERESTC